MNRTSKRSNRMVQVPHKVLVDRELSWAAKGLFATMLAAEQSWSEAELVYLTGESIRTIRRASQELQERGYLTSAGMPYFMVEQMGCGGLS